MKLREKNERMKNSLLVFVRETNQNLPIHPIFKNHYKLLFEFCSIILLINYVLAPVSPSIQTMSKKVINVLSLMIAVENKNQYYRCNPKIHSFIDCEKLNFLRFGKTAIKVIASLRGLLVIWGKFQISVEHLSDRCLAYLI